MGNDIMDILNLPSGQATQIWRLTDELPQKTELISQSSAYCFFDDKFAIVKNAKGFWAIPGGHIEKNEDPRDTVIREVMEEACLEIENLRLMGHQEIIKQDGSVIYQLRWFARVKKVLDFTPDFETTEVRFVDKEDVGKYISWWDKSRGGKAELQEAMRLNEKNTQ
jgi:8-oxo-dGTP diphosphatase